MYRSKYIDPRNYYYVTPSTAYYIKYKDIFTGKTQFVTEQTIVPYVTYIKRLLAMWDVLYQQQDSHWVYYAETIMSQLRRDLVVGYLDETFQLLLFELDKAYVRYTFLRGNN